MASDFQCHMRGGVCVRPHDCDEDGRCGVAASRATDRREPATGEPGGEATRPEASATPAVQGLTEREQFERWYVVSAFDYVRDPIGSKLCADQWAAWQARAALSAPEQAAQQADAMAPSQDESVAYPRDFFSRLIHENSPYAFYIFQWVPYQTDAKRWRLKMQHDVRTFDGREAFNVWPNGSHCGPFRDDEVEFIRISPITFCSYGFSKSTKLFSCFAEPIY